MCEAKSFSITHDKINWLHIHTLKMESSVYAQVEKAISIDHRLRLSPSSLNANLPIVREQLDCFCPRIFRRNSRRILSLIVFTLNVLFTRFTRRRRRLNCILAHVEEEEEKNRNQKQCDFKISLSSIKAAFSNNNNNKF